MTVTINKFTDRSSVTGDSSEVLAILLIMSTLMLLLWYFIGTPLQFVASVAVSFILTGLIVLGFGIALFFRSGLQRYRVHIAIVVTIALCMPIYSAIRGNQYFGQPILYGLASERHWWGIASGPVIYYLMSAGKLSAKSLETALVTLAWLSLVAFTALAVFYLMHQELASNWFDLKAISNFDGRGLRTKFPIYAIVFGALYYVARAAADKPFLNLMKSGVFVFYVLFIARGRVDLVCLLFVLVYAIYISGLYSRWRTIIVVGILYGLTGVMMPNYESTALPNDLSGREISESDIIIPEEYPNTLFGRTISDILQLVRGGKAKDDGLTARSRSLRLVTARLIDSPELLLLGSGRVSGHWRGGFSGALGTWFYPPELGLLGAVFVYGLILYVIFVGYSLLFAASVLRAASGLERPVTTAMSWLLLFLIVKFIGGMPLFYPVQFYFTAFACLALVHTVGRNLSPAR